jgi:hypothetical protein
MPRPLCSQTLNPKPQTSNPKPQNSGFAHASSPLLPNPKPQISNPKPQNSGFAHASSHLLPNPKPQTPNFKSQTPKLRVRTCLVPFALPRRCPLHVDPGVGKAIRHHGEHRRGSPCPGCGTLWTSVRGRLTPEAARREECRNRNAEGAHNQWIEHRRHGPLGGAAGKERKVGLRSSPPVAALRIRA